jgi:hypothetical protein
MGGIYLNKKLREEIFTGEYPSLEGAEKRMLTIELQKS